MALSRYLNVSVLATKVKTGIEKTFEAGDLTIHVYDDVYAYTPKTETTESYNGKIAQWNGDDITITLINASLSADPKLGEIDNVMDALLQLQSISYTDVTNIVPLKVYGYPVNSYTSAKASGVKLGNFLDRCGMTRMLEDVPGDIFSAANEAFTTAGCDTIDYNKALASDGYCLGLFNDYIEANKDAGNYN